MMMDEDVTMTDDVEQAADAAAGESNTAEPVEATVEMQLTHARAEADEYRDSWLRVRAEFANARKRIERERQEVYGLAAEDIASKFLPVLDDFERAMESLPPAIAGDSWFAGIELVQRKLRGILEALEIERITAVGEPFDPNLHEAVMQEESADYESGVISRELQSGYRRGDKIIRPALVAVAR